MRQDNTIYTFSIELSILNRPIRQEKSKLQKQISKLLILIEMTASTNKSSKVLAHTDVSRFIGILF